MSRVPPHNLEAEQALLGAMLTIRDSTRVGLDECSAADFHDPQHAFVFSAIAGCWAAGKAIDPVTVAETLRTMGALDRVGGSAGLRALQGMMPLSGHAGTYARTVADLAWLRRVIGHYGGDVVDAAYASDVELVGKLIAGGDEALEAPVGVDATEGLIDVGEIGARPVPVRKEFVIPGLLGRRERVGISAQEGIGKTSLFRQLAVMVAAGIHPFTWEPIPPKRVLHVDHENEEEDTDYEPVTGYDSLVKVAGARYQGGAMRRIRTQGIDLRARRDVRWLEAQIKAARPDLLVIGPLYKMFMGRPGSGIFSDEAAREVISALDELRVRYDVALVIEGHSPYGEGGDRAGYRWKGSALWSAWLNFTRALVIPDPMGAGNEGVPLDGTVVDVRPWGRWDRHEVGRSWPKRLQRGKSWPWEVPGMTDLALEFDQGAA